MKIKKFRKLVLEQFRRIEDNPNVRTNIGWDDGDKKPYFEYHYKPRNIVGFEAWRDLEIREFGLYKSYALIRCLTKRIDDFIAKHTKQDPNDLNEDFKQAIDYLFERNQ